MSGKTDEFIDGDLVIGAFTITDVGGGSIYIARDDGEGGGFKKSDFEKVIAEFFTANF